MKKVCAVELTNFFSFFFVGGGGGVFLFSFSRKSVFARLFFCLSFYLCLSVSLPRSLSRLCLCVFLSVLSVPLIHLPRQAFFSHHVLASTKQTRSVPNTSHSKASLPQLSHAVITLSLPLSFQSFSLPSKYKYAPHS